MSNTVTLDNTPEIDKLILDTHILIWYIEGINLSEPQVELIDKMREKSSVYISAISIWEIALLVSKERIALSIDIDEWIQRVASITGLNLMDLSIPILTQSCTLLNYEHKDPADRMIIASARSINAHLITLDQKIIDYADKGYLKIYR
jgi:PIN domain nuclease of toxin-antitoxin system